MDWGATLIFVLSLLGAIAIAEGDFVIGILAFVVIFVILSIIGAIIKSIIKNTKAPPIKSKHNQGTYSIVFSEEHFEFELEQIRKFLDAYTKTLPNEWLHIFISQKWEHEECWHDGYIEFQIILGNWWDSLLYQYPDILDYMKNVYTFDPQERSFTYSIRSGNSTTAGAFPREKINDMLQKYLDNYETKHPEMRFERHEWGATLTRGL